MESSRLITPTLIRIGGLCGVVSGLLIGISYLIHPTDVAPGQVGNTRWLVVHTGFYTALVIGIFLLQALFARYLRRARASAWGVAGYALAVISLISFSGISFTKLFVLPLLARNDPGSVAEHNIAEMVSVSPLGSSAIGLTFLVGFLLFCGNLLQSKAVPAPGAIVTMAGVVVFTTAMAAGLPFLVLRLGAVIFGAGILAMGLGLLRPAPLD